MDARSFASWVEPLAARMRESRLQVIEFALSAPAGIWERPSVLEGWSNKDLLAHIGGGNDQMLQLILRPVAAGRPVEPAVLALDTDAENARAVAARGSWPLTRVIEELEAGGEEMQDLLSCLTEDDQELRPGGATWTLGGLFRAVLAEDHDTEHLTQLRAALAVSDRGPR